MVREFEDILQDVNALFERAEAQPPYTIQLLNKAAEVKIAESQYGAQEQTIQNGFEGTVEARMLKDPNVLIGAIRDSQNRNLLQPWADSNSLFAGFAGNFNLLTQAPILLAEILDLFVERDIPEPVVYEPPPPPKVKLKGSLPKTVKAEVS